MFECVDIAWYNGEIVPRERAAPSGSTTQERQSQPPATPDVSGALTRLVARPGPPRDPTRI